MAAVDSSDADMFSHRLPRGRSQPFYNVIDQEGVGRYVAEENILCLGRWQNDTRDRRKSSAIVVPSKPMLSKAGEFMKRWDSKVERFVSNMAEEYPDD